MAINEKENCLYKLYDFPDTLDDNTIMIMQLTQRKQQVEYLLEKYPNTRNNDFYLQLLWLKNFGGLSEIPYISWHKIKDIGGKLESVRRVRQKIQNEDGNFLPTNPRILKLRQRKQERWRESIKRI